jgi:hypothetical protein
MSVANEEEKLGQRQDLPKRIALKDDPYYANCTMPAMTPFDVAILFGKVRPTRDSNGQNQLVEMYDRQVYLSHLQARALQEALQRSLSALSDLARRGGTEEQTPEKAVEQSQASS